MKPILVFPAPSALETPKSVFESTPTACFQKTDFFIMRIITQAQNKRRGETPLLLFKNFPSSLD
jgi:hypothetical protein